MSAVLGIKPGRPGPYPSDALAALTGHAESRGFLFLASGGAGHGQRRPPPLRGPPRHSGARPHVTAASGETMPWTAPLQREEAESLINIVRSAAIIVILAVTGGG